MNKRIEVHALEILPRTVRIIRGAQIRPNVEPMLDSPDRRGKGSSAVGKANSKTRQTFENPGKNK